MDAFLLSAKNIKYSTLSIVIFVEYTELPIDVAYTVAVKC